MEGTREKRGRDGDGRKGRLERERKKEREMKTILF